MTQTRTLVGVLVLVGLVVGGGLAPFLPTAEAHGDSAATSDQLQIHVQQDGDATLVLVSTYSLANQSEAAAFRGLRNDTATQEQLKQSFYSRMQTVANQTANRTGREMSVTSPAIELETHGDTGVVRLSVTWTGLLAQDGSNLVLSEPFNSGFQFDRALVVTAPDGHQIADASPTPATLTDSKARWNSLSADANFSVTVGPVDSGSGDAGTGESDSNTGSGPVSDSDSGLPVALLGGVVVLILAAAAVYLRR